MSDTLRGHKIYKDNEGSFRFCDTDDPTSTTWHRRPCGHCGLYGNSNDGEPDPCLGVLPGVTNACCGHGDSSQSYICFEGGVVIRGFSVERSVSSNNRREILFRRFQEGMYPQPMMDQIERIRAIDPEAADYLLGDEVRRLDSFDIACSLDRLFIWAKSPQGDAYWHLLDRLTVVQ